MLTKKRLREIIHNAVDNLLGEDSQKTKPVSDDKYKEMLDAMSANLDGQDNPKVGIFWYSPMINDVFGVVAVDAAKQALVDKGNMVSCTELHKYVWSKQYNYYKYHGGSKLFVGDYKYTPRGRIFWERSTNNFYIMVGSWFDDYPEALGKIKQAFDLDNEELNVIVKKGIHWEIGMGYGD